MKSLINIFKVLWGFTFILFFSVLFLAYFYWPDQVGLTFNSENKLSNLVPRENVFYLSLVVLLVFNLLFLFAIQLIGKFKANSISFLPNKQFWLNATNESYVIKVIQNWFRSLIIWVNLLYISYIIIIWVANIQVSALKMDIMNFQWLSVFLLTVFILHIFYVIIRFRIKHTDFIH